MFACCVIAEKEKVGRWLRARGQIIIKLLNHNRVNYMQQ